MNSKLTKMFFVALTTSLTINAFAQTEAQRKAIVKEYDLERLDKMSKESESFYNADLAKAIDYAKENNLPVKGVDKEGRYFELIGFIPETGMLKYYVTTNNGATGSIQTARAQYLSNGGGMGLNLEGQQMIVGIWDGGQPLASHQSLGVDRVTAKDGTSGEITEGGSEHATHVSGTMVSKGVNDIETKGFAPQAYLWSNNWANDNAEMTSQAGQGLLVSNHSYGVQYQMFLSNAAPLGTYNADARRVDALLFQTPKYLPVYAAGNDRRGVIVNNSYVLVNPTKGGADLLYGEAVAKNPVVVAAIEGIADYASASDVVMSEFSNWGPTDDFRIKPDISAKGVAVKSLSNSSTSGILVESGTSMAAPAVSGVFTLWQQYYNQLWPTRNFMRAATLKALMAATADEAGSYKNRGSNNVIVSPEGPDHRFGWGLINAKKGAEVLGAAKQNKAVVSELVLNNGEEYTYQITIPELNDAPLIAAISWTDKEHSIMSGEDDATPALVNDLDLRIFRPNGQEVFPWKLNKSFTDTYALQGDNDVDTIEKVEYKGAATGVAGPGVYTIKVRHKGTLVGGSQAFSLVVFSGDVTASVKDYKFEGFVVYPNPVKGDLILEDGMDKLKGSSIVIYDLQGKKLYNYNNAFESNEMRIDMSAFASGVYMLEVQKDGVKDVRKIVKK